MPNPTAPCPQTILGLAPLLRLALAGEDLTAIARTLIQRAAQDPAEAGALLDAAILCEFQGNPGIAADLRREALQLCRHYRIPACSEPPALRLLALKTPGPLMANVPIDCLLAGSEIELGIYYVGPELTDPEVLPEHDLLFVAIGESEAQRPLLAHWADRLVAWPKPVINDPRRILAAARDRLWKVLADVPGLAVPRVWRLDRRGLEVLATGEADLEFPVLVRPIDSHAGHGLALIEHRRQVSDLLHERADEALFVSPFVDYRSPDGLFRKYRVVFIGGRPFPVHLAISDHWMVHYLNAGMDQSAVKRAEESAFLEGFTSGFARRHAETLALIPERLGLDYVGIDCAELPDGRLLIFEADPAMIVHDADPPELYPYKRGPMQRLFAAFRAFLCEAAGRPGGLRAD